MKKRTKPLKLMKLEVLNGRIVQNHSKIHLIGSDFAKYQAGFKGEMSLDFYLKDLNEDEYHIFHDLRLPQSSNEQFYFQIDTLIVHSQFCILIEVKNLIGNLYFDHQFDQMIRTRDGVDETFSDPINQVELQKAQFAKWLKLNKFPEIPLHSLVAITNPKSYIRISPKYGKKSQKIIRGNTLVNKINGYVSSEQESVLLKKDLKRLTKYLIREDTPQNPDILRNYSIQREEIVTGVFCPKCKKPPMIRLKRTWLCLNCSGKSSNAHEKALQDYAL
ncbi:nuclease-related domain-containing protein [Fictibacillus sp. BK138]|uniref:nuclease-related domain-containing protein n=1 Tax=Fictibacillus sp. BK138 TaxID=2512121 RepID=UPI00102996B3|nr:nuclease-related domain-containing protein [Fictibacillus sp. BK138]